MTAGSWFFRVHDAEKLQRWLIGEKKVFLEKSGLFWFPPALMVLLIFVVCAAFIFE
jgi:hypothetical protein